MPELKTSWFDRALLSVFPEYGMSRLRARASVELLSRHYEAAQPGRRTQNWRRDSTDADVALRSASRELRNSARDLIRNNGYARRAQRVVANNTVGWGIRAKALGGEAAAASTLWNAWADTTECESDNRQTFYGIQHLVMRNMFADGEVFLRRRFRRLTDDLTIPLQLQVLEADYLNTAMSALVSQSGGPIIQGVEFDKLGKRVAYWMYRNHPGSGRNIDPPTRIPAEEIIHVYDVERAGQTRGVSWLAAAVLNLKDLDDYDDAEIMKQKIAACFAAFVADTEGNGAPIGLIDTANPQNPLDDSVETLEPGMIHQLPPGKTVTFGNPPTMTSDSLPARTLRRVAAGIGITYEDITSDYSQVNFSSARMARLAAWGYVHYWQQSIMIPILCQGVWNWAMEAAVVAGELRAVPASSWTPPPMQMLEPDKEGLALMRLVRTGAMTPSGMVREQGYDPDEHFAEYAADVKKLDDLKLVLDIDARRVTQVGMEQASETATNSPAPAPKAVPAGK